jgi:hypothetical protein
MGDNAPMKNNPFQVLGPTVPAMLGRQDLTERVCAYLDKERPEHVSVLGPALYGKSVLLQEVARRYAEGRPGYLGAAYFDLRRRTPKTDDELRERFAEKLAAAVEKSWPEGFELLGFDDVDLKERLSLVSRELAKTDDSVLIVMDGFDDVLANPGITNEIWEGLLSIAAEPVLRYVTGSRLPLRELCHTEESRTSDFWEIFHDVPLIVGCLNEGDWEAFLAPFEQEKVTISPPARKKLEHWTGSVPILLTALLQSTWEWAEPGATVSGEDVNQLAERLAGRRRQLLAALWEECTAEMKTDLADLTRGGLRVRAVPESRLRRLERRGFVRREGKRIVFACGLMERFVERESAGVTSLQRVFGDAELFQQNVRMLLEVRLAQVPVADKTLHGYVEQAIRHLQPEPRHSTVWVRSIADRALDLIWERELRDGITLPESWMIAWRRAGIQHLPDDGHGRVPGERGRQLRLLRYATGSGVGGRSLKRLTRWVTKPTALLVDHLQSVGNFGQHQDDEVTASFAVATCNSAIALCESLAGDLRIEADKP